jgi:transposase, IS30 family
MRQTLTVDNGADFVQFKKLENKTGLSICFADPYAAWQRGANENTNGLMRQYFPKGTNMKKITKHDVVAAVRKLSNRPRKSLDYRTPHEVFWNVAHGAPAI